MNEIKPIILAFFIVVPFFISKSQTTNTSITKSKLDRTECNLRDALGKKYGLWIEDNGNTFVYYKNNKRDGSYISYARKNGKVDRFGEYSNGKQIGKWFYFDESQHLEFTEENIKDNTELTRKTDAGDIVKPKYTSYVKNYYPNGMVKSEGQMLYQEDIQVDSYETGIWKYYDQSGKLTKVETKSE
jgi:antitoxin component YwqK of YwqJK toxin-antitoxin module